MGMGSVAWDERRQTHDGKYAGQPGLTCDDTLAAKLVKVCGGQRGGALVAPREGTPIIRDVDTHCHTRVCTG